MYSFESAPWNELVNIIINSIWSPFVKRELTVLYNDDTQTVGINLGDDVIIAPSIYSQFADFDTNAPFADYATLKEYIRVNVMPFLPLRNVDNINVELLQTTHLRFNITYGFDEDSKYIVIWNSGEQIISAYYLDYNLVNEGNRRFADWNEAKGWFAGYVRFNGLTLETSRDGYININGKPYGCNQVFPQWFDETGSIALTNNQLLAPGNRIGNVCTYDAVFNLNGAIPFATYDDLVEYIKNALFRQAIVGSVSIIPPVKATVFTYAFSSADPQDKAGPDVACDKIIITSTENILFQRTNVDGSDDMFVTRGAPYVIEGVSNAREVLVKNTKNFFMDIYVTAI